MKPYQIKLTYKGKKYQFAMLSDADDIEQSLRERFPGCECEISTNDIYERRATSTPQNGDV